MKKLFLSIIAIAALIFSSCDKKVDLYSNDGEHTIVYAILDSNADTNFFKITKSFLGNANDLTNDYDANNYTEDELEVTFTGVFEGSNNPQTVTLGTVKRWIPADDNAIFYNGCFQTYYYTTKKLREGKEYQIDIVRKSDNAKISAKAKTINSFRIRKPIQDQIIQFKDVKRFTIDWKVAEFPFLTTAAYFEITAYFHFKELMPGSSDTVYKSIRWPLNSGKAESFLTTTNNDTYYATTYTPEALFDVLRDNKYLNENSPAGVQRFWEKFEFKISATGEELYNYNIITNSSSAIQDVPNYTNIENGYGIMSSRISISSFHRINILSRNKIEQDFPQYGFVHDPNP